MIRNFSHVPIPRIITSCPRVSVTVKGIVRRSNPEINIINYEVIKWYIIPLKSNLLPQPHALQYRN